MNGLEVLFPDIEKTLVNAIPAALADVYSRTGVTAGPDVPPDSQLAAAAVKGFVRVQLLDDTDDTITRRAVVDIDVFATTRTVAYDVAQEIRGLFLSSRSLGGVVLDQGSTQSGPRRVPWDNPNVRRFLATYGVETRR